LRQANRVGQPGATDRFISFERQAYLDTSGSPVLDTSGNVLFPAGTPSDTWPYIQYCICETTTRRNIMYRVHIEVYDAVDACSSACPGGQALMSRNVLSAASDNTAVNQGFYVTKVPGYGGNSEADRYQVTLKLTYRQPGASGGSATDGRVIYRTTVVPRNYPVSNLVLYQGRSFNGLYRSYPYR
jgi:hypothetical protein